MSDQPKNCPNCMQLLSIDDKYCPGCGQKTNAHLLTVSELLSAFWNSMFNLDNSVFKTIKYIWAPWLLTKSYVDGQRKSFLNPMRTFLITLLFHFGFLVSITQIDNKTTRSLREYSELERSKLYQTFVSIKDKAKMDLAVCSFADTIEQKIFNDVNLPEKDTFFVENIFNIDKYPITRKDAIELSNDSLFSKYKITGFKDKLMVKQMIRLNLDRAGMIKYSLGNAAWGVLLTVFALAGFLKLIYYRKKKHYVEHLVLMMNIHSWAFIILSLLLFIGIKSDDEVRGFVTLLIAIFLPALIYVTLKKYYQQSSVKTFLKFLLITGFYTLMGISLILIVSIGSLLFF